MPVKFQSDFGTSVLVQPDGKLLVAGITWAADSTNSDFALARYNDDGSLDTDFGSGGKVTTSLTSRGFSIDSAYSFVLQPDGKILLAGFTADGTNNNDFGLVRYNAMARSTRASAAATMGSSPLPSWGRPGLQRCAGRQRQGFWWRAITYNLVPGSTYDIAVIRYNDDGTLDEDFGSGGIVTTDFGLSQQRIRL